MSSTESSLILVSPDKILFAKLLFTFSPSFFNMVFLKCFMFFRSLSYETGEGFRGLGDFFRSYLADSFLFALIKLEGDFLAERTLYSTNSGFDMRLKFLSGVLLNVYFTTPVYNYRVFYIKSGTLTFS